MALKATVHRVELSVADLDRNYYEDFHLTLAQHPSETAERLMVRVLAFALNADAQLTFGRGLSHEDEPALWRKSLTGDVELWIDVGHPDERRLRRACGRAQRVKVYCYAGRASDLWWRQNEGGLARLSNLSVAILRVPDIDRLAERNMKLQCTIEGGYAWITNGDLQCEAIVEPLQDETR